MHSLALGGLLAAALLSLPGGDGGDDARSLEAAAREVVMPPVRLADLPGWRAFLRPDAGDLAWEAIDWIPSFADGVRRADAEQRPLLFWAMNGHPLGCT